MSMRSAIIAGIVVLFVVVLIAVFLGGNRSAAAYGRTSTAEAMFPPQYVTAPTPILVNYPATQGSYNGVSYTASKDAYYYDNGYYSGGTAGTAKPTYASRTSYDSYRSPYSYSGYNYNSYPVYQSPWANYTAPGYNSYPTYQSPWSYYNSDPYNYNSYPVYQSAWTNYTAPGYSSYPTYQSPYGSYVSNSSYPTYQSPWGNSGYGGYGGQSVNRQYIYRSTGICSVNTFQCAAGYQRFDDLYGCGCESQWPYAY